ncbi:hypothetical protein ACIBF6_10050 [Streptosporangium amethystogenes]|uniref:hypothetical protein n=1 Tax=Streptosporangium amethystogenes TaxID=2002 RepID=UPI003795C11C
MPEPRGRTGPGGGLRTGGHVQQGDLDLLVTEKRYDKNPVYGGPRDAVITDQSPVDALLAEAVRPENPLMAPAAQSATPM